MDNKKRDKSKYRVGKRNIYENLNGKTKNEDFNKRSNNNQSKVEVLEELEIPVVDITKITETTQTLHSHKEIIENLVETPEDNLVETPEENLVETPEENLVETPEENLEETSKNASKEENKNQMPPTSQTNNKDNESLMPKSDLNEVSEKNRNNNKPKIQNNAGINSNNKNNSFTNKINQVKQRLNRNKLDKPIEEGKEKKEEKSPLKKLLNNKSNKDKVQKAAVDTVLKTIWKIPYVKITVIVVASMLFLLLVLVLLDDGSGSYGSTKSKYKELKGNPEFWWPIGSYEIANEDGVLMATGSPATLYVSSPFGKRDLVVDGEAVYNHKGIDISTGGDNVPIIAVKDGVVRTVNYFPLGSPTPSASSINAFGNLVVIDHGGGVATYYAHLRDDSITVEPGETVLQGEVIALMGNTGLSTGQHLHFEIRLNNVQVDPLNDSNLFVSAENPRPSSNEDMVTMHYSKLSKKEFVNKMEEYSSKISGTLKTNFDNNFLAHGEEIYEIATDNNLNPELVVSMARLEGSFKECGSYNYWGYSISNTISDCPVHVFDSLEDGIIELASLINSYLTPGTSAYNAIKTEQDAAADAGCDSRGTGTAGTYVGMISRYVDMGEYLVGAEHSTSGSGGCYYIRYWIDTEFMEGKYDEKFYRENCTYNTCASPGGGPGCEKTDICINSDYTYYAALQRKNILEQIFY